MKKPRIRAQDVAAEVNVSAATVSLVLNSKDAGRIPLKTRQRILDAAGRLGYTIDRRARGLATGRSGMIGFVAPDISNPFFGIVHMALLHELGDRYQVLVVATDIGEAAARHNIEQLLAIGVEAVVAISVDSAFLGAITATVPMILVDSHSSGPGVVSINFAIEKGAKELADHLLELGHRNFVYFDGATRSRIFAQQRDTLISTMVAGGAAAPVLVVAPVEVAAACARAAADCRSWFGSGATAVVCATDIQAYGVLAALRGAAIRVPADMAVASFDDLPLSVAVAPALTTVRLPALELGRVIAAEIIAILADSDRADPHAMIDVQLVVRDSTGPARRKGKRHNQNPRS